MTQDGVEDLGQLDDTTQRNELELEKKAEWHAIMADMIVQMMFVSGETAEPSPETTTIIEEIVREQVVEMVSLKHSFDFTPL